MAPPQRSQGRSRQLSIVLPVAPLCHSPFASRICTPHRHTQLLADFSLHFGKGYQPKSLIGLSSSVHIFNCHWLPALIFSLAMCLRQRQHFSAHFTLYSCLLHLPRDPRSHFRLCLSLRVGNKNKRRVRRPHKNAG